jgi:hypothetical protein
MKTLLRMLLVIVIAIAVTVPASAQVGSGVLNRLELQRLVAADTAGAHAALAKHFTALATNYRSDSARSTAFANAYIGNPNHPNHTTVRANWMQEADDATANANSARAVAAYHQLLSLGQTPRRPADATAFDGGKGARPPTSAELNNLVRAARTPSAHRELVEYFLIVARTEASNGEAYGRAAQMARVSGARSTEVIAAHYDRLASAAREAVRQADLAVELHRQLAAIG